MPIQLEPIRNIVIVGETGVGKSSLINLITGLENAHTANDVHGVTIGTECHDWVSDNRTYRLWDTPGLNEGSFVSVFQKKKQAQDVLRSFLTELGRGDEVYLMVFCMRGLHKITKDMKKTYKIIAKIRDKTAPDVPLIAVVTNLENYSSATASTDTLISLMDEWWSNNFQALSESNMQFSAHACITTLTDNCYPKLPGRRDLCQAVIRRLITQAVSQRSARNIVVVGEVGVGKSSLINLVLGSDHAETANGFSPIATYDLEIDDQAIRLWDTPGLGEGLQGSGFQKHAQEPLRSLFTDLNRRGGVHLLIVCMRGSSKTILDPFLKMHGRFCPGTPIVAITTGLEELSTPVNPTLSMEAWWLNNSGAIADKEIFSGHACITTLPDSCYPEIPGRRVACQNLVRRLIMDHSLRPQTESPKDLHVLLFGETGVGKSSVINLLAGRQIASVSPDSVPCTLDSSEYQFQLGSTTIRLWDTAGLDEPERTDDYVGAIEKAVNLIRRLNETGGISLFLFCIRENSKMTTAQSNYRLFYEILGKKEVPVALAVTHLEREENMETWWTRNSNNLEKNYGILSVGHACITSLEGHPKCSKSRDTLQRLLSRFDNQAKSSTSEAWIGRFLKGFGSLVPPSGKDLIRLLTKRCNLNSEVAERLAAYIGRHGSR